MKVLMLGNGFDLYHELLSHYEDFMTIGEYLHQKYSVIISEELDNKNVYSELCGLAEKNETIQKKLLVHEEAYKKTTINKTDYYSFLEKIHSNCWFVHFLDIKRRDGWVALENQVAEDLNKFRQSNPIGIDSFFDAIKEKNDYNDISFDHIKNYSFEKTDNIEYIFQQYNQFIEILRLYLIIFVDNVLKNISYKYKTCNEHLKNYNYVLSFNYTNTYKELYDSNANIVHIHGNLYDEIVLGVNPDKYDSVDNDDCTYIKYKKYYQRITKHTLDDLKRLVTHINLTTEQKGLFIVGHSLDVSDGDIISVLFDLFDCIVIYYLDDKVLDKHVKNLKLIFGAKELSKMTFSQKVIFQKLPPNEYMRCGNDQL